MPALDRGGRFQGGSWSGVSLFDVRSHPSIAMHGLLTDGREMVLSVISTNTTKICLFRRSVGGCEGLESHFCTHKDDLLQYDFKSLFSVGSQFMYRLCNQPGFAHLRGKISNFCGYTAIEQVTRQYRLGVS